MQMVGTYSHSTRAEHPFIIRDSDTTVIDATAGIYGNQCELVILLLHAAFTLSKNFGENDQ